MAEKQQEPLSPEAIAALMRLASYAAVTAVSCIIIIKAAVWIYTDSLALVASLVDSLLDMMVSIMNLVAIRYALLPADDNHRFGHGKAEDIATFSQSAFIAGSGLFILFEAIDRIIHPSVITNAPVGVFVMVVSSLLTLLLITFQRHVVKRTGSNIIAADMLHYKTDLLMNMTVIVAFILAGYLGWQWADPLLALLIAAYLLMGAWKLASGRSTI